MERMPPSPKEKGTNLEVRKFGDHSTMDTMTSESEPHTTVLLVASIHLHLLIHLSRNKYNTD